MINIESNIDDVIKQYRAFPQKVVKRATSRAINDSLTTTRAEFARQMTVEADVSRAVARASTELKRSTNATLNGHLSASGKPIPIRAYGARKTVDGLRVKVRGEHWNIKGAFRLKSKGNHWFKRSEGSRLPIHLVTGPPLPMALSSKKIAQLKDFLVRKFNERLAANVKYFLQRKK